MVFDGNNKGYREQLRKEAKEIVQRAQAEHAARAKREKVSAAGICAVGVHQTKAKLAFCQRCKRSFCAKHGDLKRAMCQDCQESAWP